MNTSLERGDTVALDLNEDESESVEKQSDTKNDENKENEEQEKCSHCQNTTVSLSHLKSSMYRHLVNYSPV